MWSSGGTGFGVCSVGASMIWGMQRPSSPEKDWPFTVTVHGESKDYTDEELRDLLKFSLERTADYDRMFNVRMGANLIVIGKQTDLDGKAYWLRKRMTWSHGPMFSPTLAEAMEVFKR